MNKPRISNEDIARIQSEILREQTGIGRWWIQYGAGFSAAYIGAACWELLLSVQVGATLLAIVALMHLRARTKFGTGGALLTLDKFDLTPPDAIQKIIENAPELRAQHIHIKREDWPAIFKIGIRSSALKVLECFDSKALTFVGYGGAILAMLVR